MDDTSGSVGKRLGSSPSLRLWILGSAVRPEEASLLERRGRLRDERDAALKAREDSIVSDYVSLSKWI